MQEGDPKRESAWGLQMEQWNKLPKWAKIGIPVGLGALLIWTLLRRKSKASPSATLATPVPGQPDILGGLYGGGTGGATTGGGAQGGSVANPSPVSAPQPILAVPGSPTGPPVVSSGTNQNPFAVAQLQYPNEQQAQAYNQAFGTTPGALHYIPGSGGALLTQPGSSGNAVLQQLGDPRVIPMMSAIAQSVQSQYPHGFQPGQGFSVSSRGINLTGVY